MSVFASRVPLPLPRIEDITSSTDRYDREDISLSTPSFTLCPSGEDRSMISLHLPARPLLGITPKDCSGPPSDQLWTELLPILSCLSAPLLTSTPRLPLGVLLLRPYSLCITSGGPCFPESRPGILVGYLGIYNLQTTCPDGVPTPVAMLLASEESECIPLFGCSVWCPVPVACPVPSAGHHTGTCLQTQRPPL